MIGVCFAVGATVQAFLPVTAFTLAWTHSVEKVRWEEDWRVEGSALVADEARVHGSAAGMEPPPGARLRDGVWHYRPALGPQRELRVTLSPYTADYELCTNRGCAPLSQVVAAPSVPEVVVIAPCARDNGKG